jgi:N-acetylglutamate synthase-like GNAT family acetyltransferase
MSTALPRWTIRPAEPHDLDGIRAFIHPFVEQEKILPRIEEELDRLITHGFIAEADGQIVGFATLEVYSSKLGEIRSLAVAPHLQGKGVGKQLVKACVQRARERNILEVMAITSSEDFFKSCGFDFTLPGEKKALFIHTRKEEHE